MSTQTYEVGDVLLLSYVVTSADMRYVEVNERELYLRNDPDRGLLVRGEVPGCGSSCYADLNQILLEYALSCEGCKDGLIAEESAEHFGHRLGQILVAKLYHDSPEMPAIDQLSDTFNFILNSMNVPFQISRTADSLSYDLAYCPLRQTAEKSGLNLSIAMAHRTFVALCESLQQSLAADWVLLKPTERESNDPLLEIALSIVPA